MGERKLKMIGTDLLKGAFGKNPHDVYMAYDKLTDELIVRLIDPTRLAYLQELENNDGFAFLVENESSEVIGFQLFNFEKEHLQSPSWSKLKKVWNDARQVYEAAGYTKFRYDPRKKTPRNEIFNQSATMIQKALSM
jgi:hypothetical protein